MIFAVFAHPDDEAFGPCGTLLAEAKAGTEVHLITLTAGENGTNPDNLPDLKAVRLNEWREAGRLIGATNMHYLGFPDSELNNVNMQTIAENIENIVRINTKNTHHITEIEFITNDLNGITGHIDHIVAARATCLAFYRLKSTELPVARVRLVCQSRESLPQPNTDWIYAEPGRLPEEIDQTIDNRQYREDILEIMRCHHTQRKDGQAHIQSRGDSLGVDHFMIID